MVRRERLADNTLNRMNAKIRVWTPIKAFAGDTKGRAGKSVNVPPALAAPGH
jgi:hypothetical protein